VSYLEVGLCSVVRGKPLNLQGSKAPRGGKEGDDARFSIMAGSRRKTSIMACLSVC
jgi:hypothetical protein